MIGVSEALDLIAVRAKPVGVEVLSVSSALGRVLAKDIEAPFDLPRFSNSAVDGFALTSRDLGAVGAPLPVSGSVPAGAVGVTLVESCAVRVMTGAKLPPGTAAVVMKEDVIEKDGGIVLGKEVKSGFGVRAQGEEIKKGEKVASRGDRLTPPLIGLLTSFGVRELSVFKRPTVFVVVTGNELAPPGAELAESQIYESNGAMLRAALQEVGIDASIVCCGDTLEETRTILENLGSDVIVTTGGVSVGDYDCVRGAALGLDFQEVFWKVAMKPGKPLFFAEREAQLLFGLPGNPVSALVTFVLFVAPALKAMEGGDFRSAAVTAPLADDEARSSDRTLFVRARLDKHGRVAVLDKQGSHMTSGFVGASVLAELPAGEGRLNPGDLVRVHALPWRTD